MSTTHESVSVGDVTKKVVPAGNGVPVPVKTERIREKTFPATSPTATTTTTTTTAAAIVANGAPKHDKKPSSTGGGLTAPSPMQRSRSTPSDSSPLTSPQNPHPPPTASFSPQAPIPLSHPWSMYLDDTNLWGVKSVEECLERMGYLGQVDSIQAFWSYWNAMEKKLLTEKKLGAMSCVGTMGSGPMPVPAQSPTAGSGGNGRYNWRIFDSEITPVWEDETHTAGGKYVLRCGHGELRATKWIWTKLVLSMVGSMFLHQDVVCGCVLACRPHKKEIQLWIKHPPAKRKTPAAAAAAKPPVTAEETNTPAPAAATTAATSVTSDNLPSDNPATNHSNSSSTTSSNSSTTSSPKSSPVSSPNTSPPPTATTTTTPTAIVNPPKTAVCTCHIDPVVCVANDIRFLLGVPLVMQGSNLPVIKIEYTSHEDTMADVAARNKRLKHKQHAKREAAGSNADGSKKVAKAVSEKAALEKAREERNKLRDADTAKIKEENIRKAMAENKKLSISASTSNAASVPGASPLASPSSANFPVGSPLGSPIDGPKPSPKPTPPLPSPTSTSGHYPGRKSSTWADATMEEEIDLGLESSDYATSTNTSAASSAQSTPIHTSRQLASARMGAGPQHNARKISSGSMMRQMSDPTSEAIAIQQRLDALARTDARTFEGTVGDASMISSRAGPPGGLSLMNPLAGKGQTPLKLSGEKFYHPEPDSPGMNCTPVPSPSTTPLGFYDGDKSGGATPTPRSPFTAHSPRGRDRRADSAGGSRILTTSRGAGRVSQGSGTYVGQSPEAVSFHEMSYPDDGADDDDLSDEQRMLQYDDLPAIDKQMQQHGFQLDRTRDLLRVPLDLESLSLPPAGKQPQRIRDPGAPVVRAPSSGVSIAGGSSVNGVGSGSILSMTKGAGTASSEVVAPHALKPGDHLSKLIVAAQGGRGSFSSVAGAGGGGVSTEGHSAFAAPASSHEHTPVGSRKNSSATAPLNANADEDESAAERAQKSAFGSRKKSSAGGSTLSQQQLQAKKRASKPKESSDAASAVSTRRSKPKSLKTYLIYTTIALLAALLIYFLFFTTLAPEPEYLLPERTISEKGSKIKVPKVHTK